MKYKYIVEVAITVEKKSKKAGVREWVSEALQKQADREGWLKNSKIAVRKVDME